ncbi:uncharacterized protein LOC134219970 [Armigeres subalbatus]|uniref:uncharacterized protein LOC134219970 n=1 Tax=Armigeres subalbatus TaxID=124917 RepID=UPI002ED0B296
MSHRENVPSLIQLGYVPNHTEHWAEIEFHEKISHLDLIDHRLKSLRKPNIHVRIGSTVFDCHSLLLQSYSGTFDELENERVVVLPEEKVSPRAFQIIYDWMLAAKADVQREHFVEVLVAAEYLRIKHLVDQCWICIDSTEALVEDRAFFLYIEAAQHHQNILKNMLLKRICAFFLPLVACSEYTQMPLDDLSVLLKSSYLGVFSETDVFYAACLWLLEDWDNRQECVSDVMNLVRFALIRPSLLAQLNSLDADERLHDILRNETTKHLVAQALNYAFSSKSSSELPDSSSTGTRRVKRLEMQKPTERTWLDDADSSRADGEHEVFSFAHDDYGYETFLERLSYLTRDRDCWKRWKKLEVSVEMLLSSSFTRLPSVSSECEEEPLQEL